jgi:hypothetical protein
MPSKEQSHLEILLRIRPTGRLLAQNAKKDGSATTDIVADVSRVDKVRAEFGKMLEFFSASSRLVGPLPFQTNRLIQKIPKVGAHSFQESREIAFQ